MQFKTPDFSIVDTSESPNATLRPISMKNVKLTNGFWRDRYTVSYKASLEHLYKRMVDPEISHCLANLEIAAKLREGQFQGVHWSDAWVYKWIEAASVFSATENDPALSEKIDALVSVIEKAQEEDGYLASQVTATNHERYEHYHIHELYTMGHLLTAAVIHYRFLEKTSLLDVAIKVADYVYNTFMDCDPELTDMAHNPSIIMGLVELYRITGKKTHLELAKAFIDMRGKKPTGEDQTQDTVPFREEEDVVGHAVFFTYLYAGAADVYLEIHDKNILDQLARYFEILRTKKSYITGGVASVHYGLSIRAHKICEAAGPDYYLPSGTAYNETCAQVGSFMWNWRMLLITGDAAYSEFMENTLYNGILPGISLEGTSWFYPNVLRAYQGYRPHITRTDKQLNKRVQPGEPPERGSICCPTNVLRTFAEIAHYLYSASEDCFWVHQYCSSNVEAVVNNTSLSLSLETDIPWGDSFTMTVQHDVEKPLAIRVRIPDWSERPTLVINGEIQPEPLERGAYHTVEKQWRAGDTLQFAFPKKVRFVEAHPFVENLRNQIAVIYGPLVYCLESTDMPADTKISEIYLSPDTKLKPRFDSSLLGGITVLEGTTRKIQRLNWENKLYQPLNTNVPHPFEIRMIPYYAWANREASEMSVWLPLMRS